MIYDISTMYVKISFVFCVLYFIIHKKSVILIVH